MMRSLFSGVAGLKVHQTRMDVIGNNIANVNTTAYKSQSMVFSDLLYQTTQAASGANGETGRGGTNARQIGLGAKTGAISTAITQPGSAQSTNNPWDVMITGESFFVVSNGSQNFFTRDGSFTIDGAGNLVMASTGYTVMGWQVDEETGDVRADIVSALRIMNEENMTYPAAATTKGYMSGIVDKYDSALHSTEGRMVTLSFYDNVGYRYTGKFAIHALDEPGEYYITLTDILNQQGESLVKDFNISNISEVASFGSDNVVESDAAYQLLDTAAYDEATNTYSMKYYPGNFLAGYSGNPVISASKTVDIKLDDNAAVTVNQDVTIEGKVEFTRSELTAPGFNLIYEDGKYYAQGAKEADDIVAKGAELPSVGSGTDGAWTPEDLAKWATALSSFSDKVDMDITEVSVDEAGKVSLTYNMTLQATQAGKYDADGKYLSGDEIENPLEAYGLENTSDTTYSISYVAPSGLAQIHKTFTYTGNKLVYDTENGTFSYVGTQGNDSVTLSFNDSATSRNGVTIPLTQFYDIDIDFSLSKNVNNGGSSTAAMTRGDRTNGTGDGRAEGKLTGVEIAQDGKITAYYDNNQNKLLGQIAVANFANASGLSKQGDNLYSATANSGEFDGIGSDITADGGYMTSGVIEMSNVDLSQEFTDMITTQRGFQANSRIITVSDTLLEELVNLKR